MRKTNPIHNMLNAAKPENHPLVYLKKKFEYFLNAVHYCLFLEEIWSTRIIEKGMQRLFHGLSVLLNFERFYEKKMEERRKNKDLHEYFYGKKSGQSISLAHHWFGFFYSGYPCFFRLF